jgi:SAM-dependent methyltransferase
VLKLQRQPRSRHRQDWEDLAAHDPLWAVLSAPELKGGGWKIAPFLATGEADVDALIAAAAELGRPRERGRVLDFGCGVGRLARPFAARFDEYVGIDVARGMVERAGELHADLPSCTFVAHADPDLRLFEDRSFDLVYSNLVLQHLPNRKTAERYLAEFLRVVRADGLIVFQALSALTLLHRLQPTRRLYALLRRLGADAGFLQSRLGLHPIRLLALPEATTRALLERHGGELLRVTGEELGGISSRWYYLTAAPRRQSPR